MTRCLKHAIVPCSFYTYIALPCRVAFRHVLSCRIVLAEFKGSGRNKSHWCLQRETRHKSCSKTMAIMWKLRD